MRLRIVHETAYEYEDPVTTSHHQVHLAPRDTEGQTCISHELSIHPMPGVVRERIDYFKNRACYFGIHEPHRSLRIVARSEVSMRRRTQPLPLWSPPWEEARDLVARDRRPEVLDAYAFVFDSRYVNANDELREFAKPSFLPGRPILEAVLDLTKRIFTGFVYDQTATQISTPIAEVMQRRRGVCQDFAHLQIGCLRSVGLAARYVSGYLLTMPPPGKPKLVGADASHAWVSTYFPNAGWVDFDPANNVMPSDSHVTVAYGRDFGDVTPVRGVILGGGRHALSVSVDVARVEGD
jgi:transglutaminase-like putative cysteine protease